MSENIAITERRGVALASLIARRDQTGALRAAIRDHYRAELPLTPLFAEGDGATFIWAGPERWLVTSPASDLLASLRACVDGLAAVCDQTDSRVLLRVSGSYADETLAKGVPVDLHPSVFASGSTAITVATHIGCQLWKIDDAPTYDIAVPRSLAASFRHWLDAAAAEFGETAPSD